MLAAEDRMMLSGVGIALANLLLIAFGAFLALVKINGADQDVDRARFMLECRYDWSLSYETCEGMLRGEAPPTELPKGQITTHEDEDEDYN